MDDSFDDPFLPAPYLGNGKIAYAGIDAGSMVAVWNWFDWFDDSVTATFRLRTPSARTTYKMVSTVVTFLFSFFSTTIAKRACSPCETDCGRTECGLKKIEPGGS